MGTGKDAIVVGAGIVGATSAFAMAKAGWKVRLVDSHPEPGMGASFGNGRQLSYSYTNALASPDILAELPRLALGLDPGFRLRLAPSISSLRWLTRFLRNCTAKRYRQNTLDVLQLAEKSRMEMQSFLNNNPIDFDQRNAGKLILFSDQESFKNAKSMLEAKIASGSHQTAISAAEVQELEPATRQYSELVGAIYAPDDQTGDCALFAKRLIQLATKNYGAIFDRDHSVASLSPQGGKTAVNFPDGDEALTDMAVVCSGYHANHLLGPMGHKLPLIPMKGYSFTAPRTAMSPQVSITDAVRRIVFTDLGERVLVAGLADLGSNGADYAKERMDALVRAAKSSLPGAADYDAASDFWVGHRPLTPDSLPITRRLSRSLAVNTGHGMLGWTLAMGSAAILVEELARTH